MEQPAVQQSSQTATLTVSDVNVEPAAKTRCVATSLFSHYQKMRDRSNSTTPLQQERTLNMYLDSINQEDVQNEFNPAELNDFFMKADKNLFPLFARIFCITASSAPVERVFSQSGLIMRPNRAKMTNDLLESLVFLKCNDKLVLSL